MRTKLTPNYYNPSINLFKGAFQSYYLFLNAFATHLLKELKHFAFFKKYLKGFNNLVELLKQYIPLPKEFQLP